MGIIHLLPNFEFCYRVVWVDKVGCRDEGVGAILSPTRHIPYHATFTLRFLMDMRHVKFFSTARALRSCGVGQVQREAVQVAMMRWEGGKEECDARRGQLVARSPSPDLESETVPHVLNLTKFGFAVRVSRASHVQRNAFIT